MAGRIRQSDIEEVKARTNIADLIGEHVSLRTAGVGSLKGLCPFHDERSPSFNVRPALGVYHCFGCGESGDAIAFLQKTEHVTFTEAVERLAGRLGYTLHYEDGEPSRDAGMRSRLLAANTAAAEFFAERLREPEAEAGRRFLGERGFDAAAAQRFGVGFAPNSWDALRGALKAKGFGDEQLLAAGLVSQGDRGVYDRFRGRLVWPIKDTSGQVLGFGARRLRDDDNGPKYLNTPETAVYHKNQVLYGLDLARKDIAGQHRVVVVEGYTDVMACHLAGITTAVATCGTAFGVEHIRTIRRIMDDSRPGEVVFTFDPDAAGRNAALRAFDEEKRFTAQTFVAVAPEGLDPCDLRLARGDGAVRELVDGKRPLFEFVIRQKLADFDLDTVEGRAGALRVTAPIVADIRDPSLRPGYTRELARMLGMELAEVGGAVRRARGASSAGNRRDAATTPGPGPRSPAGRAEPPGEEPPAEQVPSIRMLPVDPVTRLERDALMALLQRPDLVPEELYFRAVSAPVGNRMLQVVRDALAAEPPVEPVPTGAGWFDRLRGAVPSSFERFLYELQTLPLPESREQAMPRYVPGVVTELVARGLVARKAELNARLQRLGVDGSPESRELQRQLAEVESERRRLTEAG